MFFVSFFLWWGSHQGSYLTLCMRVTSGLIFDTLYEGHIRAHIWHFVWGSHQDSYLTLCMRVTSGLIFDTLYEGHIRAHICKRPIGLRVVVQFVNIFDWTVKDEGMVTWHDPKWDVVWCVPLKIEKNEKDLILH